MRPLLIIVGAIYLSIVALLAAKFIPDAAEMLNTKHRKVPLWIREVLMALVVLSWPITLPLGIWLALRKD